MLKYVVLPLYPRYRFIRPFLRRFLRNIDCFCMQSARHSERIIDLGADPSRVTVTGSLKFDAVVPDTGKPSPAARLIPPGRPVLVAGSTLAPEEEILLEAFEGCPNRIEIGIHGSLVIC